MWLNIPKTDGKRPMALALKYTLNLFVVIALLPLELVAAEVFFFRDLPSALKTYFPLRKVNDSHVNKDGVFTLLFSEENPDRIAMPKWEILLNGESYNLLACYGGILANRDSAFVIGTSIEAPTFGKLIILGQDFTFLGSSDCQKIVRMELIDVLNDGVSEIVTWEDHHYGTHTTRRELNIYKINSANKLVRIFAHDLIDATFWPGGPHGTNREIHYLIDFTSKAPQQIIVTSDEGDTLMYSWSGSQFETKIDACRNNESLK